MEENDIMNASPPTKNYFLIFFVLQVFLLTTWGILLQISHYSMFSSACSVKQSEHMLFCKQERDYTLERSLSNVIWSINFHRDPVSIRKKKTWLIYFIYFIHSSQTASHTFLLLLKSPGKKVNPLYMKYLYLSISHLEI